MKVLFVFASLLFTINVFSQSTKPNETGNLYKNPVYYLDSIQVDGLGIFDTRKIEDIKVVPGDSAFPNGRIYLKSKNSSDFNFLSANDILKAYKIPEGTSAIFMLDNEIIKDTTTFKIDSSYIKNVQVIKASEIEYLPNNIPSLAILKVFTSKKENNDKLKVIKIRRNNSVSLN